MQTTWKTKYIYTLALLCLSIGCVSPITTYRSQVDSLAQPDSQGKNHYILLPGNKDLSPDDLQFLEYSSYIERALSERGFKKANNFTEPDIAIFLTYGIGDPQTNSYSYSMPVWGQTGISGSYTTGNVNVYGNNASYSQNTTYIPTYGITGSTSHQMNYTTYTRFLSLEAIDIARYKLDKRIIQIWKTNVRSIGRSGDLRLVFPFMVTAMRPYFGTNTGRSISVEISENDPSVEKIRGLAPKR